MTKDELLDTVALRERVARLEALAEAAYIVLAHGPSAPTAEAANEIRKFKITVAFTILELVDEAKGPDEA